MLEASALSRRDHALDAALERLAPGPHAVEERPDSPDHHITAVRRLPAVAGQFEIGRAHV